MLYLVWRIRPAPIGVNYMGINIRILAEREVDQTLYYNHECHLELRECIHDHIEDFRMVYGKDEFLNLSDHWIRARKVYDEAGQPEPAEQNIDLSYTTLEGERLHHQRAALEFTVGGAPKDGGGDTIHFHYRHGRIHLTKRDFFRLARMFQEGLVSYSKYYQSIVDIKDPSTKLRDVAREVYLPWLAEYDEGKYPKEDPDAFWDMYLEHRNYIRPEEIQRPDGGWLRDRPRTRNVPEEFDRRYLFTVLESIKKYGYAEGPFKYELVRAQPVRGSDLIEITGSHRAACLVHLGYRNIPVVITN